MCAADDLDYSLSDLILDRFCSHILPKINQKIQRLHLESLTMEHILRATNYPNLHAINLHNIQAKTAKDLFTGKIFFIL
jgi:DNA topoisomerase IA